MRYLRGTTYQMHANCMRVYVCVYVCTESVISKKQLKAASDWYVRKMSGEVMKERWRVGASRPFAHFELNVNSCSPPTLVRLKNAYEQSKAVAGIVVDEEVPAEAATKSNATKAVEVAGEADDPKYAGTCWFWKNNECPGLIEIPQLSQLNFCHVFSYLFFPFPFHFILFLYFFFGIFCQHFEEIGAVEK